MEAPREAGRLTWLTVEDTASLSAAQYQWSHARVRAAELRRVRVPRLGQQL
jgi:hypothetical protein